MKRRLTINISPAAVTIFCFTVIVLVACAADYSDELVQATKKGEIETVKRLLDNGADVETRDSKFNSSLLMWAAHEGHADILELLIQKGAIIDASKQDGQTALWFAAEKGQMETLEILVRNGADVNVIGWEGDSALEVARKYGHQEVVDYLQNAGAGG